MSCNRDSTNSIKHNFQNSNTEYCDCGSVLNPHFQYSEIRIAKRISRPIRYDILDPDFLEDLAKIADYGAKKYGDLNWQLSRLTTDKGPVNHMYKHLGSYRKNEPYDHEELGTQRSLHLAAIAFNAMMEYYWAKKEEQKEIEKMVEKQEVKRTSDSDHTSSY